jgi:hypothetical protein
MHRSHLDGVPVFRFTESGLVHAALRFGVGTRDETFRTLGITRVVAALAVETVRRRIPEEPQLAVPVGVGIGVGVGVEETCFTVSGRAEDVAARLTALSLALSELSDLSAERLEEVARRLHHEVDETVDPRAVAALNARYGSHTAGLECGKHGWHHLPTAGMVLEHTAAFFTRANAVLTFTGPDPAGLRLPLPQGVRPRRTAPAARYPRTPWTHRDIDGVVLSVEAPVDSAAAAVAHRILRERLASALGRGSEAAAPVEVTAALHDRGRLVRLLVTSATASDAEAVAATVWREAMRLARQEPASEELVRARTEAEGLPARLRTLDDVARGELFGTPCLDEGSRRRAVESVTPRDVRDAWQEAMAQAQLVVPQGLLLDPRRPGQSSPVVHVLLDLGRAGPVGEVFRPPLARRAFTRASERHWMVLTAESIVACTPGAYHELRFDDVVALERWGPARNVIGPCGCPVGIDPASYRGGAAGSRRR